MSYAQDPEYLELAEKTATHTLECVTVTVDGCTMSVENTSMYPISIDIFMIGGWFSSDFQTQKCVNASTTTQFKFDRKIRSHEVKFSEPDLLFSHDQSRMKSIEAAFKFQDKHADSSQKYVIESNANGNIFSFQCNLPEIMDKLRFIRALQHYEIEKLEKYLALDTRTFTLSFMLSEYGSREKWTLAFTKIE